MEQRSAKVAFGVLLVASGTVLNLLGIGAREFFTYNSVGQYLVYCGFLLLGIILLKEVTGRKKQIDERMMYVGYRASYIALLSVMVLGFLLMIFDGITPIQEPLHLVISYFICAVLLVYVVAYNLLLLRH